MISTLQALGLGALQGVTEFLPISSSGHLVVVRSLLHIPEPPVLFDVLLHVATLVVIILHFRFRVAAIAVAVARFAAGRIGREDPDFRLAQAIAVASVATAAVGIPMQRLILQEARSIEFVAAAFLVTAAALVAARLRRAAGDRAEVGLWLALIVGVGQGIAILPGISRAGFTISIALLSGLPRERAGEFAFLISIPAVLGALLLSVGGASTLLSGSGWGAILIGPGAALAVGAVSLVALMRLLRSGRLHWFAAYLTPLGIYGLLAS